MEQQSVFFRWISSWKGKVTFTRKFIRKSYKRLSVLLWKMKREISVFLLMLSTLVGVQLYMDGVFMSRFTLMEQKCNPQDNEFHLILDNITESDLEAFESKMTSSEDKKRTQKTARERIALIIPYRDREQHLRIFLRNMIPFLQKQDVDFHIFILEQTAGKLFNRAVLMNVGFLEASIRGPFDCYIFHDVDLLPENECIRYKCWDNPLHLPTHMDINNYSLTYPQYFGGGIALTAKHMQRINGFSNNFFGWGGEDDEAYFRVGQARLTIYRYSPDVARYTMIKHQRDSGNPKSGHTLEDVTTITQYSALDGLNSVQYQLQGVTKRRFYSKFIISLEHGPEANYTIAKHFAEEIYQLAKRAKTHHDLFF